MLFALTMSSPPRQRRRILGLGPNPRAARAQANEDEIARRAAFAQVRNDQNIGLDIPDSEHSQDSFNLDSDSDDIRASRRAPPQAAAAAAAAAPAAAPPAAAALSARSRQLWLGNDAKLNIVASLFLLQPERQEMLAIASQDPERIAAIRQIKRDPSRDLDHDNLKHSGKKFIIIKTCEELNEHAGFAQFLPGNQRILPETLRQKIKEFTDIAAICPESDIDRSI
jgi:hypothetical protein